MPKISRINQLSLLKSLPYSWNIKISMIDCTQNSVLQGKEYIAILHQVNFPLTILLCSILHFFFFVYVVQHLNQPSQLLPAACILHQAFYSISSLFYSISIKISINFTIVTLSSSSWLPAILHQPSWNFWEFQLWSPVNKPLPRQYQVLNNIYLAIITIFLKANDHYHTIKSLNRSIINHKQYKCMKSYMIILCNNSNENHQIRNLLPTLPWNL